MINLFRSLNNCMPKEPMKPNLLVFHKRTQTKYWFGFAVSSWTHFQVPFVLLFAFFISWQLPVESRPWMWFGVENIHKNNTDHWELEECNSKNCKNDNFQFKNSFLTIVCLLQTTMLVTVLLGSQPQAMLATVHKQQFVFC